MGDPSVKERVSQLEAEVAALRERFDAVTAFVGLSEGGARLVAPVTIVDASGGLLARIERTDRQNVVVSLLDERGQALLFMGLYPGGGWLSIRDRAGQNVISLDAEDSGGRIIVSDGDGDDDGGGVVLYVDDDGGGINVLHRRAEFSAVLNSTPEGGRLELYDAETDEPFVTIAKSPAPEM